MALIWNLIKTYPDFPIALLGFLITLIPLPYCDVIGLWVFFGACGILIIRSLGPLIYNAIWKKKQ